MFFGVIQSFFLHTISVIEAFMDKLAILPASSARNRGALQIATLYLTLGSLWILFSDRVAARIAVNKEMLAAISLYKGWGYVLLTAALLYWLIRNHTLRLQASDVQFHRVIDALPALVSYIDTDRHYQVTNEAYKEWFGEKAQGKPMQEVLGEATYKKISKYVDKALKGETVYYETEIPYHEGGERYVGATYIPDTGPNGHIQGFFALVTDMTEHRQIQEELRRWADAFEGCAHGIAIGDPNTNRVLACNPAFASLHKCRVEDIVGSAILSLYRAADHELVRRNIEKADQIGHVRYEAHMVRKDGSTFPVEMDVVSVLGEDGEVLHRVETAQDISERKASDEKLRESETKYRTLVEHLPAITYISEPDQYVGVSYISPQIEALGFTSNAWLTDPEFWLRHIHSEDREQVMAELSEFKAGADSFKAEYRLLLPGGEVRWFHDESIRVKDQAGQTILKQGFMLDITESKKAEEVLQESEERYRIVSELTSDYAYRDRVEDDGSIIPEWITDSFARITGYSLEETQAPGFWQQLVYPEDVPIFVEHLQIVLSGQPHMMESRVVTKNGQLRWLRDYSNPIWDANQARVTGLYGAVKDITEYKHSEQKLMLQALWLDQINDAVITSDTNLVITGWNPAAERIYGWKAEEVIGRTGEEILKSEFFSKTRLEVLQELRESGKFSAEITQLRKDGSRIHIETRTVLLRDESGQRIGNLSVNRDISERKQAEENLRRFKLLSEHSRDIILFMTHKDGRILDANTAAQRAYGYSHDELMVLTIQDLRASDVRGLTADQMAQAAAGGILFETIHRRKDGTTFPVEVSSQGATIGGVRTLISIVRDITDRKRSEQALQASQEQLLSLIKQAPLSIAMFDQEMRYIVASQRWVSEYGRGHSDLVGRSHYEIHPDIPEPWKEAHHRGLTGESLKNDNDMWTWADGTKNWLRWAIVPWQNTQGEIGGIIISAEDITENKRAEEALRLKDELLRLTSEMAKVGGWEFNPETGQGTWTDEVARIHDLDPAQETNVAIGLSFYTGESRKKVEQAVQEAIELGKPYDMELEMVTAKGNEKWVRTMALPFIENDKVIKVQGIFQDITERKQIEEALQVAHSELELKVAERTAALSEANALLQSLMDSMPEHIYFKDMQSRFIRNSRSQASLLGLSDPAEAVGKSDFDFFPHAAKAYAEEQEVMRSGIPMVDFEEWVVWPDGREMWVSTTKMPLRNSDGQTIGIFGISHDITERKRAEQEIQQLNTDLEKQAEQLQASNKELEAFSYSVSHDLRAPLRAIDGYTRILVEDYTAILDDEGKRICSIISGEARRMGQLIDDLLAFSRLGRKEIYSSKIDMKSLAVSVLNDLLKEEDRARLDFHITRLPSIQADSSLIRQVWVNLLSNAIKFTSKKERSVIDVGSKANEDEVIYYVRDSGAGFDMEYANKLFGVFQRLHSENEFEGTGVGLAIVQRIIRRHGGHVWAEGEMDKGATFYFALPRKEDHYE